MLLSLGSLLFLISSTSGQCIIQGTNPSCSDTQDGSIKVFNTDLNTSNKKYDLYKNGVFQLSATSSPNSPYTFKNLPADSFSVEMFSFDDNSSTWISVCTKTAVLVQPAPLSVSYIKSNVTCKGLNNGLIDLTITGGTQPYEITWSNGATSQDIKDLSPGKYVVFISDLKGCSTSGIYDITEPAQPLASAIGSQNSDCTNKSGSVDLTVSGGTPPYVYSWSNGETTQDLTGVGAGDYKVTVTDYNGCIKKDSTTIDAPANNLSLTTGTLAVSCYKNSDGKAWVKANNGKAPINYSWSNGYTADSILNVQAGDYTVVVTDADNCSKTGKVTVSQPDSLALSLQVTDVKCKDGKTGAITLTVKGGNGSFQYLWTGGKTTKDLTNIPIGTYSVTVTDPKGCSASGQATVSEPASVLTTEIVSTDLNCYGGNSGTIDLTINGGTPPYKVSWSNGATTEDIFNLTAGIYQAAIYDANGCKVGDFAEIHQPAQPLVLNTIVGGLKCYGDVNATVQLEATGGLAPYSFKWGDKDTNTYHSGLYEGSYKAEVKDANNCVVKKDINIKSPGALISTITGTIGCTGYDGAIDLYVEGGTAPYVFQWNNGETSQSLVRQRPDSFLVVITDANGCIKKDSIVLTEQAHKCVGVPTGFTPNGDGFNDVWTLKNIESFPMATVDVFNAEGGLVYSSEAGYPVAWNGTYKGEPLLAGTYLYVIDLKNNEKRLSGTVTIIR